MDHINATLFIKAQNGINQLLEQVAFDNLLDKERERRINGIRNFITAMVMISKEERRINPKTPTLPIPIVITKVYNV